MNKNIDSKENNDMEKEYRRRAKIGWLSILKIVLFFLFLFTIFSDKAFGLCINVLSVYFRWVIEVYINKLEFKQLKGIKKFKIGEFYTFVFIFILFIVKLFLYYKIQI